MKINVTTSIPAKTDLVVLWASSTEKLSVLPAEVKSAADQMLKLPDSKNNHMVIPGNTCKYYYLINAKNVKYLDCDLERARMLAASVSDIAEKFNVNKITLLLDGADADMVIYELIEGLLISFYRFEKYKIKPSKVFDNADINIKVNKTLLTKATEQLNRIKIIVDALNASRDMANEPANVVYPETVAKYCQTMAKKYGLGCTVFNATDLKKHGFEGHIAVGQGSTKPPYMVTLEYKPKNAKKGKDALHLGLVGKGLTFDSGGISIKPSLGMGVMKMDMSGACATIHTMQAIAQLKPSIPVTAVICLAENMPDGNATLPANIIKYKNGKTVEINNTDAEGRLVLADGIIRAGEMGATHIVDIATLTGSCGIALGSRYAGLMSIADDKFIKLLSDIGYKTGEWLWQMPMPTAYKEYMVSKVADLSNMSSAAFSGMITASWFLQEFVPEGKKYIHIDIAGTMIAEKPERYYITYGSIGFGVRLLTEFALEFGNHKL